MSIPKMSSKELNNILTKAQTDFEDARQRIELIKIDMLEKNIVLRNEQEYTFHQMMKLREMIENSEDSNKLKGVANKALFFNNPTLEGIFESYGSVVHPRFLRPPINVFNLMTANGPMFRDDVYVSINGEKTQRSKHILMHDNSPAKSIVFNEYDDDILVLNILTDIGYVLGDTDFNVIELDPYLPGSFDIIKLEIFTDKMNIEQGVEPDFEIENMNNVGKTRIVLDRKYPVVEVTFTIRLKFKNHNGKYPFGLKHLYFLNADFDPNSYVVAKIEKNDFIQTISDEAFLKNQFEKRLISLREEGIKLYLTNTNGVLEYELPTSRQHEQNELARNTKEFYVRVPLQSSAITSVEFSEINTR